MRWSNGDGEGRYEGAVAATTCAPAGVDERAMEGGGEGERAMEAGAGEGERAMEAGAAAGDGERANGMPRTGDACSGCCAKGTTLLNDENEEAETALPVDDGVLSLAARILAREAAPLLRQAGQDLRADQVLVPFIGTRFQKETSSDGATKPTLHWLHKA